MASWESEWNPLSNLKFKLCVKLSTAACAWHVKSLHFRVTTQWHKNKLSREWSPPHFILRNLGPHIRGYSDKQTKQLKLQATKLLSTEQQLFLLYFLWFTDQAYNDGKSISVWVGSWKININHNIVDVKVRKLVKDRETHHIQWVISSRKAFPTKGS